MLFCKYTLIFSILVLKGNLKKIKGGNFMAVVTVKEPSSLRLKFNHGNDDNGKAIIKTKSYQNVKAQALSDDLYAVAKSLAGLQEYDLFEVARLDNTSLSE